MPEKTYNKNERRRIVAALRAEARRTGKEPDFRQLAKDLGPARTTLARWYREAMESGPLDDDDAPAAVTDEERARASWLLHHENNDEVVDTLVATTLALIREARADKSWTAAARMDSEVRALVLERRGKGDSGASRWPMDATPDEWVAMVVQMPEILLEAFLASSELWTDPRLDHALGPRTGRAA
jgi:transposase-like protein